MSKLKVMVIDDSAIVRQVLSGIINEAAGMEVVDTAQDPIFALQKLEKNKPDAIISSSPISLISRLRIILLTSS